MQAMKMDLFPYVQCSVFADAIHYVGERIFFYAVGVLVCWLIVYEYNLIMCPPTERHCSAAFLFVSLFASRAPAWAATYGEQPTLQSS